MNTGAWTNLIPASCILATRAFVPRGDVVE
jgi:hypothetical protein